MAVHQFGGAEFFDNVYVEGGMAFASPQSIVISPDGTVDLTIQVIELGGNNNGFVNTGAFSSDVNFPIDHITSAGGQYQIRLDNNNLNTIRINGGSVYT